MSSLAGTWAAKRDARSWRGAGICWVREPLGMPFREHGVRLEVADGLCAVWSTQSWSGYSLLDHIDEFFASAAALLG
jgi:hypothetical protein